MQHSTAIDRQRHETVQHAAGDAATPVASTVLSADGTSIAFERIGSGAPIILVDGAMCYRGLGPSHELATLLAPHFSVFTYDRRGRGLSGDTLPYAVAREVEDIEALLDVAGGAASLWGNSSGAVLALEAARHLQSRITQLALYEAPFIVDNTRPSTENDWAQISDAVAAGRRGAAVKLFMQSVGMPWYVIAPLRLTPMWRRLEKIAHTLPYDGAIVRRNQKGKPLSATEWATVKTTTLVMAGAKSAEWMRHGNESLARVLPNARFCTLEGQTHVLNPEAHVKTLVDFFNS